MRERRNVGIHARGEPVASPPPPSQVGASAGLHNNAEPAGRLSALRGPRSLLIASTGGHLMELVTLRDRLQLLGRPLWVTFDTPQSRSLLSGEDVVFVEHTAPRDWRRVLANFRRALALLRAHEVVETISTGSAVALSFLPAAAMARVPSHYIESAARTSDPSATGRILQHFRPMRLYSQYNSSADSRWHFGGSVFDAYKSAPSAPDAPLGLRVLVTLGTQAFRFDRLVDAVKIALPAESSVVWQLGPNFYGTLPGVTHGMMSADAFSEACELADVIITQSGVGSALNAFEAGRAPILVPRRFDYGEHIDDHQTLIAAELHERGLAQMFSPEELTAERIRRAARKRVVRNESVATFGLLRSSTESASQRSPAPARKG